jgi:bacterial/archaeal transporter family-2 protein
MNNFHWITLAAGLLLPIQVVFNNKLTSISGSPTTSSLISFSVGTITLLLFSILRPTSFQKSLQHLDQAPWYAWLGGLVGAFYIITTVLASPRIGIIIFLAIVIGGQLITSALVEHYGWLGTPVKPFHWAKGLGLAFIIIGMIFMKK